MTPPRHISRGVALWHSRLFRLTDNAHLLCIDARSGNLLWDIAYADWNKNYGATGAPLVVNDKVIVGTSGGDDGVRGFVAAYDANSGKLLWRFWTIPGRENSAHPAGLVTCICMVAERRGCRAPTMPRPIPYFGQPVIRDRF
jgi:outer membrane protein assembly factor BamB